MDPVLFSLDLEGTVEKSYFRGNEGPVDLEGEWSRGRA